jgi:hypothetical protein
MTLKLSPLMAKEESSFLDPFIIQEAPLRYISFWVIVFSCFYQMGILKFLPFCFFQCLLSDLHKKVDFFFQMWPDLIQKAKEGGLDVIQTYVFWNGHEPSPGKVIITNVFFSSFA